MDPQYLQRGARRDGRSASNTSFAEYAGKLQRQVLERDGWRCQVCGSMQRLQVHHLKLRSQSGADAEHNLITLCAECHARMHSKGYHAAVCLDA
jgi:5-methylcytosine-specific restriction endonuclease McrA